MKTVLLGLFVLMALVPISFAATDCEKTCCQTYDGRWDDDFDDCKSYKPGYDSCVSACEAKVWESMPQGPGPASPENTYTCKYPAILAMIGIGALLVGRKN